MVQRNALVYSHVWRGSICLSFLQPIFFLLAMGTGVGALVNRGNAAALGGLSFLEFLAPGLLAAACMQTASFESAYPITAKMTWNRNYQGIAATPMRVRDIVLGELAWMGVRLSMVATAFTIVIFAFGVPRSWIAVLAIPSAVLAGLAFSVCIMGYSVTLRSGGQFSAMFRFIITPLFLFSGVFFPVSRLPQPLQAIAWVTPLFHGMELTRGLILNTVETPAWIIHVMYLLLMVGLGILVSFRNFDRKLRA